MKSELEGHICEILTESNCMLTIKTALFPELIRVSANKEF